MCLLMMDKLKEVFNMDEKRAWEEIQYAKKTGKLMKELAELSGFTVSGTVKLTSRQNGISINIHFSETDK